MKKIVAVLLTLVMLLGLSPAALARTSATRPDNSGYAFTYAVPENVLTEDDVKLGVTLKTAVLGQEGYEDAYIKFSATGPGSVNFSKDTDNTYLNQGTLADFDLPAQYSSTTNWTLKFTEDGTYKITFSLYDAADRELTKKTQEIKVSDGLIIFTAPEKVTVDSTSTVSFKLVTELDYDDVHLAFAKTSGDGDVTFKTQDSNDDWYTLTNKGDLQPASFDIAGPYSKTTTAKLTFSKAGTYTITLKLLDEDDDVLFQGSQKIVAKSAAVEEEDDDEDEDEEKNDDRKGGKGKTHGLVNALRNHLKFKQNGKSPSESQSIKRLMELLEDRGLAQDLLDNLKDAISELEDSISELEKAIAAKDGNDEDYKALAKMKALKGKKYETYINGKKVNYEDAEPVLEKNRTLVPFRKLAEILGADVSWNQEKQEVTVKKAGKTVVLALNKTIATVDGKTVILDAPAKLYKNRTLVPLRFLAEAFDTSVDYYPEGALISIKNK